MSNLNSITVTTHILKWTSFWSWNRPMPKWHKYWSVKSQLWKLSKHHHLKSPKSIWCWPAHQCNSSKNFMPIQVRIHAFSVLIRCRKWSVKYVRALCLIVTSLQSANTIAVANAANKTQSITLQDLKFLSSGNKCFLPITVKDGSNNDQQIMAQIDTKNLVLPGTYLQMKVDPQQITTVDGQQVVQLTSATNLPTSISMAQPQYVQTQQSDSIHQATMVPETRTIFAGGQNITITQVSKCLAMKLWIVD